jgi:Leucine-rich repeat (LRR) protein
MEGIERFPNLKSIELVHNNISKIDNISDLTQLLTLRIDDNPISKIENLETSTSLKGLYLNDCNISKIEGLENLDLQGISLCNNQIKRIEGINHMVNLTELHLDNNQIQKIEGLDKIIKLKSLTLSSNPITEIEGFAFFSNLQRFRCSAVPEFENVDFDMIQSYAFIALLRFICIVKINNPFDVPDIAKIVSRVPLGYELLTGLHYVGFFIDTPVPIKRKWNMITRIGSSSKLVRGLRNSFKPFSIIQNACLS